MRGTLQREPVRVYLYGVVVAVVGLLAALDLLNEATVNPVLTVGAALLAVPAVEVARQKVSPTATVNVTDGRPEPEQSVFEEVEAEEIISEEADLEAWLDGVVNDSEEDV